MMSMMINKEVKSINRTGPDSSGTSGSRVKAMPPLTLYRPPAARNDIQQRCRPEPQSPLITHQSNCIRTPSVTPTGHRLQSQALPTSQTK